LLVDEVEVVLEEAGVSADESLALMKVCEPEP
jgi:hypothetical protein